MDETWIHFYEPETKQQSLVWKSPGSHTPQKAQATKSVNKEMSTVYFYIKGIILIHPVLPGKVVTGDYH